MAVQLANQYKGGRKLRRSQELFMLTLPAGVDNEVKVGTSTKATLFVRGSSSFSVSFDHEFRDYATCWYGELRPLMQAQNVRASRPLDVVSVVRSWTNFWPRQRQTPGNERRRSSWFPLLGPLCPYPNKYV